MEQSYKEKYEQAIERLKQWDREHPCAGYVLSDRDKFIFPELAESEDEKIRKSIFKVLSKKDARDVLISQGIEVSDALAWLENQGDYANFRDKAQVGDRITKNEDGVLVNLSQLKRVAKPREKQCEQEFEMKTAEESLGIDSDTYNKIVDECIFGEQKLTEFERGLFDMLTDISKPCTADCVKSHSEKLLSIARKMITLEQKPEENKGNIGGISSNWSEEDERLCQCLIEDQEEALDKVSNNKYGHSEIISDLKEMYHERIDWLKSLKDKVQPQNKWKPSDEQMHVLRNLAEASIGFQHSKTLISLYDDLKKL